MYNFAHACGSLWAARTRYQTRQPSHGSNRCKLCLAGAKTTRYVTWKRWNSLDHCTRKGRLICRSWMLRACSAAATDPRTRMYRTRSTTLSALPRLVPTLISYFLFRWWDCGNRVFHVHADDMAVAGKCLVMAGILLSQPQIHSASARTL